MMEGQGQVRAMNPGTATLLRSSCASVEKGTAFSLDGACRFVHAGVGVSG